MDAKIAAFVGMLVLGGPAVGSSAESPADTEIWGWNKECTELAVLSSNPTDTAASARLAIYKVGANKPVRSVTLPNRTSAEVGREAAWPVRPQPKWAEGAMRIEPLWAAVESEGGQCEVRVGFVLRHQNQVRYQPEVAAGLRTSCLGLSLTDTRLAWGKPDIGAVLLRLSHSPAPGLNESTRLPLSVSWQHARPVRMVVRTAWPASDPKAQSVLTLLKPYGEVSLEATAASAGSRLSYAEGFRALARRLAGGLGTRVVSEQPPAGTDLLVVATDTVAQALTNRGADTGTAGKPRDHGCTVTLPDCKK